MSHASSAPLRMTEMRERYLWLKRGGARHAEVAAGRDGLLWPAQKTPDEPDKLLWMEDGVEKGSPELDEPTGTWLEESSEWTRPTGMGGASGSYDAEGGQTPPDKLIWLQT